MEAIPYGSAGINCAVAIANEQMLGRLDSHVFRFYFSFHIKGKLMPYIDPIHTNFFSFPL